MSRFMLRRSANKDVSLLHAVNFLIANQVMSLEDSRPIVRAFHLKGEDVVLAIPDELDSAFRDALNAVPFRYEQI